jgi:hypothetical protein
MVTLAPSFWACGEAEHHGGNTWQSKTAHLMVTRKQKERAHFYDEAFP